MSGEVKNADFKQTKQKKTTTKQTKKLRFFSAQIKKKHVRVFNKPTGLQVCKCVWGT